jgi:hypothetical protein
MKWEAWMKRIRESLYSDEGEHVVGKTRAANDRGKTREDQEAGHSLILINI